MLWNLSTRSPLQVLRDIGTGLRDRGTFMRGFIAFLAGLALLLVSATLLVPVAVSSRVFLVLEIWTILTGLLAEQLAGDDLWVRTRIKR